LKTKKNGGTRNNAGVKGLFRELWVWVLGWFLGLALVVLGPLLLPGYLLLLDYPSGPHVPWISLFPLPSEAFISAGAPVIALLRALALLLPEQTPKLLVAFAIIVAGIGLFRFLTVCISVRPIPALVGATWFAINPFVYDRAISGQLLILLAYAMLPWALPSFLRLQQQGTVSPWVRSVLWTTIIGIVSVQLGIMALLLLLASIVLGNRRLIQKVASLAGALAAWILVHLYWLLPLAASVTDRNVRTGDINVYATRPHSAAVLPSVLLLHGFWRTEFVTPLKSYPVIFILSLIPLLVAAVGGVIISMRSDRYRAPAIALGLVSIVALVLAMGTSFPMTAPISRFLFANLPGYGLFREPQKWLALMALAYAVFAAVGLDALTTILQRWRYAPRLVSVALLLPLIATHIMLWGFMGRVDVSKFPNGWARAEQATVGRSGKLLFLPWHLYEPLPFTQDRIVANPASSYFTMPTLVSTSASLGKRNATPATDPRTNYVAHLLDDPLRLHHFGHLVAPLGVHYIALAKVADAWLYRFLARQNDLRRIFDTRSLALYRNTAFRGDLYSLRPKPISGSVHRVIGRARLQREASKSLIASSRRLNRKGISGPAFTQHLSLWKRISVPRMDYLGTDLGCKDGWRLGESLPLCNLGVVAAFPPQKVRAQALWRPGFGTQLIGYLISGAALLALSAAWFGTRRKAS
jgi:hypothetical protein